MAATENDAFCAVADIEAKLQRGTFEDGASATVPTKQQVLEFMQQRAGEIQAALWGVGLKVTPASGSNPIDDSDDVGKAITQVVRLANVLAVAGDVVAARDSRQDTEPPEAAVLLWDQYENTKEAAKLLAMQSGQLTATAVRSATETGGITQATFAEEDFNSERKRSEMFHLGTEW